MPGYQDIEKHRETGEPCIVTMPNVMYEKNNPRIEKALEKHLGFPVIVVDVKEVVTSNRNHVVEKDPQGDVFILVYQNRHLGTLHPIGLRKMHAK